MFVSNSTSHLVKLHIWKRTCSPTVELKLTLTQNVRRHLVEQDHRESAQCNFACSKAGNPRRHMKIHSLQKPNQCKWCEFSSITKQDFTQHLLTHSGEKQHHCKECGSSFSRAQHLKAHLRVHSGEKPYKCPQCNYSSAQSGPLKRHMTTHPKAAA